jgi:hypothetical protein
VRNSSAIHLRDAEVQFEFPADNVQAWASRPVLSKTALVQVNAVATDPWRMAFGWRISHLPSGDSIEFTFQAVDPSSEKFEAVLYNSDGIIFERIKGEPRAEQTGLSQGKSEKVLKPFALIAAIPIILFIITSTIIYSHKNLQKIITISGCELQVNSNYEPYDKDAFLWWKVPSRIKYQILNNGDQDCAIQSTKMMVINPFVIRTGEVLEREAVSQRRPEIVDVNVLVGVSNTSIVATTVPAYAVR